MLLKSAAILSILSATCLLSAAREDYDNCAPMPAAPCYSPSEPACIYCLGPLNVAGNPAFGPLTCDGDVIFSVAGFYWNAHEDGLEYALDNPSQHPADNISGPDFQLFHPINLAVSPLNNIGSDIFNAKYISPEFKWNFGFKLDLGYVSPCDGWDYLLTWTRYKGYASRYSESDVDSNHTLMPLWSAFAAAQGHVLYNTVIQSKWHLDLNMVDLELGRQFWSSRYLTLRPFIGLRFASINQKFIIQHEGGSWGLRTTTPLQSPYNNEVSIRNNFFGVGPRAGLDSVWNFGRQFGLYGNLAASLLYGKFKIHHRERNELAISPASTTTILDSHDGFRNTSGVLDLGLGFQWFTYFSDCRYAFFARVGWEHHLFFDQNQMFRVNRKNVTPLGDDSFDSFGNNTGENTIIQSRGDLSVQGWTLHLVFAF